MWIGSKKYLPVTATASNIIALMKSNLGGLKEVICIGRGRFSLREKALNFIESKIVKHMQSMNKWMLLLDIKPNIGYAIAIINEVMNPPIIMMRILFNPYFWAAL